MCDESKSVSEEKEEISYEDKCSIFIDKLESKCPNVINVQMTTIAYVSHGDIKINHIAASVLQSDGLDILSNFIDSLNDVDGNYIVCVSPEYIAGNTILQVYLRELTKRGMLIDFVIDRKNAGFTLSQWMEDLLTQQSDGGD